jgi:uncharacterized protein (DUF342 family)
MGAVDGYPQINTADDGLILTVFPPKEGGKKMPFDAVKAEVEGRGVKAVHWDEVKKAVEAATGRPVVLIAPKAKVGDAQIFVEISADEMEAKVTVLPPERGGRPADLERVKAALAANGVSYGILEDELRKMEGPITAMTDPAKVYVPVEAVIAKGKPVVHGTDAYLEKYYDKKKEEPKAAGPQQVENKNARVDYRDLNVIENVEKGTVLAKRIPLTKGEMGTTVTGREIFPDEGKDMVLKPGAGVALDPADPNTFVATETGQVVIKGETLSVLAIYEINGDLTMKIGNVDFLGTVLIHGSINGEFKVKAGADVVIDGVLDGGEVIAGGNVTIKGGVIGAKTRVTAEGEINAKYIRNAYVESGSIITIQDTSMHSTLIASDKVQLTGRGHLVGGTTVAGWEVIAKEIGAKSNTPTEIEVGEDPRLRDEMKRIESETKNLTEQLDKAKKGIVFLKDLSTKMAGKLPDEKKELLGKLTRTQFKLLGDLKQVQNRKSEIENKEASQKGGKRRAKVSANGLIYPGTKVTVSRVSKAITMETKFCTLVEDNGQIKSNPYS